MKKNKMMRLASGLLVAVLITTSTISGTFAKYVTSDSAEDTARVAKFGVTVKATGDEDLFKTSYEAGNETVVSSGTDKVVAPGTTNATGMTFTVSGTPEVDVKLDVVVTSKDGTITDNAALKTVFLKAGTDYPDMTTGIETDDFDVANDYYPVKFTLKQTKDTDGAATVTTTTYDTLKELADALEGLSTTRYEANQDLDDQFGKIEITWAWDFQTSEGAPGAYDETDKKDTLLGDLAVTPTLIDAANYNLNVDFKVAVVVTQLD